MLQSEQKEWQRGRGAYRVCGVKGWWMLFECVCCTARHDYAFHLIWRAHTMMYYAGQRWLSHYSLLQFSMCQTYLCRKLNSIYHAIRQDTICALPLYVLCYVGVYWWVCVCVYAVCIRNNNALSRVVSVVLLRPQIDCIDLILRIRNHDRATLAHPLCCIDWVCVIENNSLFQCGMSALLTSYISRRKLFPLSLFLSLSVSRYFKFQFCRI